MGMSLAATSYWRVKELANKGNIEMEWDEISKTWIVVYDGTVFDGENLEDVILEAYNG